VDKDKISRAYAITPTCEAGRVFLPERAPWIEEFLDELMMFPAGPHDDQVDSFTQALEYLNRPMPGQGWLDYVEGTVKRMEAEDRAGWGGLWARAASICALKSRFTMQFRWPAPSIISTRTSGRICCSGSTQLWRCLLEPRESQDLSLHG